MGGLADEADRDRNASNEISDLAADILTFRLSKGSLTEKLLNTRSLFRLFAWQRKRLTRTRSSAARLATEAPLFAKASVGAGPLHDIVTWLRATRYVNRPSPSATIGGRNHAQHRWLELPPFRPDRWQVGAP